MAPLAPWIGTATRWISETLPAFLDKIERHYGKAERIWVLDRSIPTEAQLQKMRERVHTPDQSTASPLQ